MRVALLQYFIAWADKETNLRMAEEHIAALAGKADVAVLPEMFATGFCCGVPDGTRGSVGCLTNHPELAETMDGEIMTTLQRIANQYEIAIVSSFICLPISNSAASHSPSGLPIGGTPSPFQAKLRNRGFMITPHSVYPNREELEGGSNLPSLQGGDGGRLFIQDKRHLYAHGGEDLFFQPAQKRHIFEYKGVKFLLLVCYDLRFPAWARNQSGSDYDVILVVANWPEVRVQYWDALVAARATENQCYIAAVNCVGDDGMGLHYNGHSVAYDTRLQPIVSFADNEEGTKIADFDIDALHHFREVLPLWKDVDQFELKK